MSIQINILSVSIAAYLLLNFFILGRFYKDLKLDFTLRGRIILSILTIPFGGLYLGIDFTITFMKLVIKHSGLFGLVTYFQLFFTNKFNTPEYINNELPKVNEHWYFIVEKKKAGKRLKWNERIILHQLSIVNKRHNYTYTPPPIDPNDIMGMGENGYFKF